jgi:hypothetical protein
LLVIRVHGLRLHTQQRKQRVLNERGNIAGCTQERVDAGRAYRWLNILFKLMGNGDAVRPRAAIAQSRDQVERVIDLVRLIEPEKQALWRSDFDLLGQQPKRRLQQHGPVEMGD